MTIAIPERLVFEGILNGLHTIRHAWSGWCVYPWSDLADAMEVDTMSGSGRRHSNIQMVPYSSSKPPPQLSPCLKSVRFPRQDPSGLRVVPGCFAVIRQQRLNMHNAPPGKSSSEPSIGVFQFPAPMAPIYATGSRELVCANS